MAVILLMACLINISNNFADPAALLARLVALALAAVLWGLVKAATPLTERERAAPFWVRLTGPRGLALRVSLVLAGALLGLVITLLRARH